MVAGFCALSAGMCFQPATAQQIPSEEQLDVELAQAIPSRLLPSEEAKAIALEAEQAPEQADESKNQLAVQQIVPTALPPLNFTLRDIKFTSSGYLTAEELSAVEAQFVGRRMTEAGLAVMVDAINALYRARNLALAEAIVEAVDPARGLVSVELFEARLGATNYTSKNTSNAYLDFRLGLKVGDLADNNRIDERLVRLAITDGVLVDAAFNPGAARGLTNLDLTLSEPAPFSGSFGLSNYGPPSKGVVQASGTFRVTSLTGWNDPLSLGLTGSQGSISLNGSYGRIVTPDGTRLTSSAGYSYSKAISGPSIVSHGAFADIGVSMPLVLEQQKRLYANTNLQIFRDTADLGGVGIVDQTGWFASAGLSAQYFGDGWQVLTAGSARFGVYDDVIANQAGTIFADVSGQLAASIGLGQDFILSLSSGAQYALLNGMPSRFQFSVTSPFAVRGYTTDHSSADSGYWSQLQIQRAFPVSGLPENLIVQPYAFVDAGEAFETTSGTPIGLGAAISTGAGMALQYGSSVSGDVFVAKPLTDITGFTAAGQWSLMGSINFRF